jgi:hypothetical protein
MDSSSGHPVLSKSQDTIPTAGTKREPYGTWAESISRCPVKLVIRALTLDCGAGALKAVVGITFTTVAPASKMAAVTWVANVVLLWTFVSPSGCFSGSSTNKSWSSRRFGQMILFDQIDLAPRSNDFTRASKRSPRLSAQIRDQSGFFLPSNKLRGFRRIRSAHMVEMRRVPLLRKTIR